MDSTRKKVVFVNQLIRTLELDKARAIHARAEILAEDQTFRSAFDTVTCRALSDWDKIIQLAAPFLAVPSRIIAFKGGDPKADEQTILDKIHEVGEEIHTAATIQVSFTAYQLPVLGDSRTLVVIDLI